MASKKSLPVTKKATPKKVAKTAVAKTAVKKVTKKTVIKKKDPAQPFKKGVRVDYAKMALALHKKLKGELRGRE